jgi:TolB protein
MTAIALRPLSPTNRLRRAVVLWVCVAATLLIAATMALAQSAAQEPLEITVAPGDFRPIRVAVQPFFAANPELRAAADEITDVVTGDLTNSGLFRALAPAGFTAPLDGFDAPPDYDAWRADEAEALVVGRVETMPDARLRVSFRLYDVAAQTQLEGLQVLVSDAARRRAGHKIADVAYAALTGETGYFDTRIVFIDETGPKDARVKRLAIMDQDGANLRTLSSGRDLVLTPRFSPAAQEILYISYETGAPQVYLYSLETRQREALGVFPGMTFAPRFSPDGRQVVLSLAEDGNTDIYLIDLATRQRRRLTRGPAIDTAPSFSPDGAQIVFESDRGEGQQIYVMTAGAGEASARRISFGEGRYSTPVWSPRGDLIAFTKIADGRFQVGVMRPDGSDERVLDSTFHSEGPAWAPNGRVLTFFREEPGAEGASSIWSVDVAGLNLRRLPTPNHASDPAWSPLLP